jgi:hypothetical protein
VRRRIGIDRRPIDVTSEHGVHLLEGFVWADQTERRERIRRAIAIVRERPANLMQGEYVDALPSVLAGRDLDVLTVVYDSASTSYLRDDDYAKLVAAIEREGERGSLAWISYEHPRGEAAPGFKLEAQVWPDGERVHLVRLDGHANSMDWLVGA